MVNTVAQSFNPKMNWDSHDLDKLRQKVWSEDDDFVYQNALLCIDSTVFDGIGLKLVFKYSRRY